MLLDTRINLLEANIDLSLIQQDALIRILRHFRLWLIYPILSPMVAVITWIIILELNLAIKKKKIKKKKSQHYSVSGVVSLVVSLSLPTLHFD